MKNLSVRSGAAGLRCALSVIIFGLFAGCYLEGDIEALRPKKKEVIQYTASFDANGGSGAAPAAQTMGADSVITIPNQAGLSRDTDVFGGWNTNDSGTGTNYNAGDSCAVTGDITLYARWIPAGTRFTVSFESNGGSPVSSQVVIVGDTAIQPADSTQDGFFLDGWYRDPELNIKYDFASPVTDDITLYAKWNALTDGVRLVIFDSNGGSHVESEIVAFGHTVNRPADPTQAGYTFDNWYSDEGLSAVYDFGTPVTDNVTLYAKWNGNTAAIEITIAELEDAAVAAIPGGLSLSRSGSPTATITVQNGESYNGGITWMYKDETLGTGSSLTLNIGPAYSGHNYAYNFIGEHALSVIVVKNGVRYSVTVEFEVTE